jgi:DNA-binding transcriptional LysR family regulator
LGAQLLVRNTKGVSLTKAGGDFLVYAKNILSLRDRAIYSANGGDRGANGVVDIISSTIPAQHLLPEIIASFQEQWPNIVFRLEQADSRRVEREMGSFHYDFGMVGAVPESGRFNCYPVYDDELVLILPKGTQQKSVRQKGKDVRANFADFIRETPFIMREAGSGTRKEIETLLSKIGIDLGELRVPAYFPDANGILLAVSRGMGASLVSKVAAGMYVDAELVEAVEMKNPLFRRKIYLLCNKELWLSPVQQAFVSHARGYF